MSITVINAIGLGEFLESVDRLSGIVHGPMNALSSQCAGGAHEVDHVPPSITIAVLTRVGVLQMPVECVAHELIVKAQTVIAKGAGPWRVKFLHDLLQTLEFAYAFCRQFVWCNARHQ